MVSHSAPLEGAILTGRSLKHETVSRMPAAASQRPARLLLSGCDWWSGGGRTRCTLRPFLSAAVIIPCQRGAPPCSASACCWGLRLPSHTDRQSRSRAFTLTHNLSHKSIPPHTQTHTYSLSLSHSHTHTETDGC